MQPLPFERQALAARPHVVVVDDDLQIGALLSRYLQAQQMEVSIAGDGGQLRELLRGRAADVVLLDLGLPDGDGLELIRELRTRWQGPIIIVSGRGDTVERVVGLELGADDYVTKPFELRELLARIRSVLRRTNPPRAAAGAGQAAGFRFADFHLDTATRSMLRADGTEVALTTGEFNLLIALLERARRTVSRDELMDALHGHAPGPFDRSIDVQVGRLRRKLGDDPAHPRIIKAVRGAGYLFAAEVARH